MRKNHNVKGNTQLRQLLIRETAKLMYEEGISQFHTAKWKAARRILSRGGGHVGKIRSCDLPSNGEISQATYELAKFYEGDDLGSRLFLMRIEALGVMEHLTEFSPRLIGSVSTGRIKKTSDIDLHIFTDELEKLEQYLNELNWPFEKDEININYQGKFRDFTHIYLDKDFPVELSVYPLSERRIRARSSTDGLPIQRLSYQNVLTLIEKDHADKWAEYLEAVS